MKLVTCICVLFLVIVLDLTIGGYKVLEAADFPGAGYIDRFNRDDEAPLDTSLWTDDIFGVGDGCQLISNTARKGGGGGSAGCWLSQSSFGPRQTAYIKLPNASSHAQDTTVSLLYCLQDTPGASTVDGYALRFQKRSDADDLEIHTVTNGSYSQAANTIEQEVGDGDIIGVQHFVDGTHNVWLKPSGGTWSMVGSVSDATYDCSNTYLGLNIANSSHHVDDFGGGTIFSGRVGVAPPGPFD